MLGQFNNEQLNRTIEILLGSSSSLSPPPMKKRVDEYTRIPAKTSNIAWKFWKGSRTQPALSWQLAWQSLRFYPNLGRDLGTVTVLWNIRKATKRQGNCRRKDSVPRDNRVLNSWPVCKPATAQRPPPKTIAAPTQPSVCSIASVYKYFDPSSSVTNTGRFPVTAAARLTPSTRWLFAAYIVGRSPAVDHPRRLQMNPPCCCVLLFVRRRTKIWRMEKIIVNDVMQREMRSYAPQSRHPSYEGRIFAKKREFCAAGLVFPILCIDKDQPHTATTKYYEYYYYEYIVVSSTHSS